MTRERFQGKGYTYALKGFGLTNAVLCRSFSQICICEYSNSHQASKRSSFERENR